MPEQQNMFHYTSYSLNGGKEGFHIKMTVIHLRTLGIKFIRLGRQRGRVFRAPPPDLKSGGHEFKSRSDHLAGVVSWRILFQLLGHACK